MAHEGLSSSCASAHGSPAKNVEHLVAKFNTSLRRWKDHKAYVKAQIDPLKEALRSAHRNATVDNLDTLDLAVAVEEFEELISNICATSDGNVGCEVTTQILQEQLVLDIPETVGNRQIHGVNDTEPAQPVEGRLKVRAKGDVHIGELEQVITRYHSRTISTIDIGLKSLANSVRRPNSVSPLVAERSANAGSSKHYLQKQEHALSSLGDQIQAILDRARLLSTNLLYGSWNAACEMLESCNDHAGTEDLAMQPDPQLVKEELEYVLASAGDLSKLFDIDADQLENMLREINVYESPLRIALGDTRPQIPVSSSQ